MIWVYTVCHRDFLNISADEKKQTNFVAIGALRVNCVKIPECPDGQEFKICGSACPATCQPEPGSCSDACVSGCFCAEGTVLDYDGTCIPPEECPCVRDDGSRLANGGISTSYSAAECTRW